MSATVNLAFAKARRYPLLRIWLLWLCGMIAIGVLSGISVLAKGLAATNLNDSLPWGLWITVDLSAIALGAGAFTFSAAVYIFKLRRYETIARAAVFVGLLGYSSAMLALFVDIGRPDRFYHPLIYWRVRSVLWEIVLCDVFYTTVLVFEFAPTIIESTALRRSKLAYNIGQQLHSFMPLVALVGMGLSILHQSLLGATYGVLTARPVWYSPSAPVLFILSAVAAGPALTLLVTLLSGEFLKKHMVPTDVINGVARYIGFASVAYLYFKLWSWVAVTYYTRLPAHAAGIELLNENTPYDVMFWWGEVLMGALLPAIILLWPRLRSNRYLLMMAAVMIIGGVVINRWNATLAGLVVPMDWSPGVLNVFPVNSYRPSLAEWGVVIGILGYSWMGFTLGVRYLKLYPHTVPLRPTRSVSAPAAAVESAGELSPAQSSR